jgi:hypothetical protein
MQLLAVEAPSSGVTGALAPKRLELGHELLGRRFAGDLREVVTDHLVEGDPAASGETASTLEKPILQR